MPGPVARLTASARRVLNETPVELRRAAGCVIVASIACSLLSTSKVPGAIYHALFTAASGIGFVPGPLADAVAIVFSHISGPFVLLITIAAVGVATTASAGRFRLWPLLILLLWCVGRPMFWNGVGRVTGFRGLSNGLSTELLLFSAFLAVECALLSVVLRSWRAGVLLATLQATALLLAMAMAQAQTRAAPLHWAFWAVAVFSQPLLCTMIMLEALVRRAERHRGLRCPRCGYDLRGGATACCPECGEAIAAPAPE